MKRPAGPDDRTLSAAEIVKTPCTDLGRKIWRKITILGELQEGRD